MIAIDAYTNKGNSIFELSKRKKVILVFLRHFGCNFCRETLSEIEQIKSDLDENQAKIILVHQSSKKYASEILPIYDLNDLEHISDTGQVLFKSYGLENHGYFEIFKPRVFLGFIRSLFKGHLFGKVTSNPLQLPGVFVIEKEEVVEQFIYRNIAQMPPILELAS
ncbi:MAG: redoxin domain-containing protein [Bacteroidota bacterium]